MKTLGDLIDAALDRVDSRKPRSWVQSSQLRGKRKLWSPQQAAMQLARAQSVQRRALREAEEDFKITH